MPGRYRSDRFDQHLVFSERRRFFEAGKSITRPFGHVLANPKLSLCTRVTLRDKRDRQASRTNTATPYTLSSSFASRRNSGSRLELLTWRSPDTP